jgi:xanthine dehydrogenase accessory factor
MSATDWLQAACRLLRFEPAIVRITVAEVRGSAPRECGATMLVCTQSLWGTIGGGNLEWQAIEKAQRWLREERSAAATLVELRLGPDLAQCCGGVVVLWMERLPFAHLSALERLLPQRGMPAAAAIRTTFRDGRIERAACADTASPCRLRRVDACIELTERGTDPGLPLWIFGAGHVGQAVLRALDELPLFDVHCLDSRAAMLPRPRAAHIHVQRAPEPAESVAMAPAGTAYLVLTHDHELDYQICAAVLARHDAHWLGLIGSASKAARFRSRLQRDGFSEAQIQRLCSPVGVTAVPSKLPAAIAVSIVAQLLTLTATQTAQATAQACDPACRRCDVPLLDADLPS